MPIQLDPFTRVINACLCPSAGGWPPGFPDESLFTSTDVGVWGLQQTSFDQGSTNVVLTGTGGPTSWTVSNDATCTVTSTMPTEVATGFQSTFIGPPIAFRSPAEEYVTNTWSCSASRTGSSPNFTYTANGSSVPTIIAPDDRIDIRSYNINSQTRACDGRFYGSGFYTIEQIIDDFDAQAADIVALLQLPTHGIFTYPWGAKLYWVFDSTLPNLVSTYNSGGTLQGEYSLKYKIYVQS